MMELIASAQYVRVIEVYFLGDLIKRIHVDIFGKNHSWAKDAHTELSLRELLLEKESAGAKRFLLSKLSRKALMKTEARHLLLERLIDEEAASEIISHLENLSLFDDAYLLESKIRSGMRKNLGKERIRRDLWKMKVPEELFEEIFKKVQKEENIDPVAQILIFIKKKGKGQHEEFAIRHSLTRKLLQRGFELDDIYRALTSIS